MRLIEPQGYQKLTRRQRISCTNGCESLGVKFFALSSIIHSFQYQFEDVWPSKVHKRHADQLFLENMMLQCSGIESLVKRFLRKQQARVCFYFARVYGIKFYNYGKRRI